MVWVVLLKWSMIGPIRQQINEFGIPINSQTLNMRRGK